MKIGALIIVGLSRDLVCYIWIRYIDLSICIGLFLVLKRFLSILLKKRLNNFHICNENEEQSYFYIF